MDFVFLSRKKLLIILESQILPFKEIFKKKIFRIPDYQRGYSWEQTQLEDLWADLSNIHLQNNAYHFTGILTINNFSEQDYESLEREGFQNLVNREQGVVAINGEFYTPHNLVDGQQRLTTILILLSQLIKKIKNEAERLQFSRQYFFMYDNGNKYLFGYHVDVPSHHYLIRDIFEDDSYSAEDTETLYTHNLDFAKDFFNKKIVGYSQNNIKDLITKITDRLLFSVLNLSEASGNNLDISMVFETLNFRGKQLSGLERFKNRVLYLLSKQNSTPSNIAKRRRDVNNTWLEIYKWLGRNPNPKKVMDDDAFLKAFWLFYFSDDTMVAKEFKANQKNLFEKDFSLLNIYGNQFMNLEIFNLLGNETKNFVSSFVNELAKALDKGNNMNIGVVYGLDNEKITLLNPENGKEEDIYIYTTENELEKLHNHGIYENIYKMNKLDFYNLYSGQKVQLNGDKCELYNGEIDIKNDDAWYKLDDLYGVLRDNENTNFVVQKITGDKIYLTHKNGSGSIYTYKELYPDFCVGDIVKRVNGKYIK